MVTYDIYVKINTMRGTSKNSQKFVILKVTQFTTLLYWKGCRNKDKWLRSYAEGQVVSRRPPPHVRYG